MHFPAKIFATILAFAPIVSFASNPVLVGYGSSDAVLPAKNQELFLMGFKLGFEHKLIGRKSSEVLSLDQSTGSSPLGAIVSARRLLAKDVVMLVGYPTSQEALLAEKLAKEKGVLSISAAAGHNDLGKMGPTVYSLGESTSSSVQQTLKFSGQNFSGKRGLIISNPYSVFSKNQEDIYVEEKSRPNNSRITYETAHLNSALIIDQALMRQLKSSSFDFIILTAYASESAKVLEQLEANRIDLPMIVSSSWTMDDVDFGRRFLTARKSPTFVPSDWSQTEHYAPQFEKLVKNKYGRASSPEIAAGFDLGVIAASVLNPLKGHVSKEQVVKEFQSQKCFHNLSTGDLCFDPRGGHAVREITFKQFTASGFVSVPAPVKE